jgi:predicted ATP-dependent endonuclease of OLD family
VDLTVEDLSVLLGANGCGKSGVLSSLNLFYNMDINVEKEDFYNNETNEAISITVRFYRLTAYEKKLFDAYLEGDELSIEKVIEFNELRVSQKYYGTRYAQADFEPFRGATGGNMRIEYEKLQKKSDYSSFPKYTNRENANQTLEQWELANREKCIKKRDDGQFFGFQNVGMHRLEKFTKFIFVPAVQEASEEGMEGKGRGRGSLFEEMMQIVVTSSLMASEEIAKLQEETEKKYKELIDPTKNAQLMSLESNLTETLSYYVPDSQVGIKWIDETGIQIVAPRALVTLKEGGYENTIDRCGHGLQRAYVLALFQQLGIIQTLTSIEEEGEEKSTVNLPSLIIGIEEPELYQHPDRQRHFAQVLLNLSRSGVKGVIESTQIIYSTHSPLLVDFQRFNELRIFRKVDSTEEEKPKVTQVTFSTLSQNARFLEKVKEFRENAISDEGLRQRLVQIMSPWMNEGFFAKTVVLVEGIKDRALVLGEALTRNLDFERMGIAVIPCGGKDSIPETISIYKSLKIPLFVVWDADAGKPEGITANRRIMKCFDKEPEDYPCCSSEDFCCVKTNLESFFREEIGEAPFQRITNKYCEDYSLGKPSYSMENPYIVKKFIELFRQEGFESPKLKEIVDLITKKFETS